MPMYTATLTNAESGQEYYLPEGSLVTANRTSGGGTTKLQIKDGAGNWGDVTDSSDNNVEITSGFISEGIAISGVYRWEQTGTAVTAVSLRAGG